MTLSGTTAFELDVTEYIEEAFERCGLEVRTGYDLKTAKRSLNLMLADWANRGLNQWTIQRTTVPLVTGTREYALGTETIDVLSAVVRRTGTDFAMARVSRDTDLNTPNKTTTGRPSQFFVSRSIDPVLLVWPTPENDTDVIILGPPRAHGRRGGRYKYGGHALPVLPCVGRGFGVLHFAQALPSADAIA
jgi:hypothetical protein